ncbi:hypothetical protein [Phytoactinopolyspora endophytica]|uniref:hypothetical protein n=1 Tax=Phytoactinopolyspora endophytica TaxID=1642495 RepID=UPI00101DE1EF|nr:hypothetical protein [Phytoactinopolyspora endophytica]
MTSTPANPWLTVIVGLGLVSTAVGLMLYTHAVGEDSPHNDMSSEIAAGAGLAGVGLVMLIIWLAVAAVCWQIRNLRR